MNKKKTQKIKITPRPKPKQPKRNKNLILQTLIALILRELAKEHRYRL